MSRDDDTVEWGVSLVAILETIILGHNLHQVTATHVIDEIILFIISQNL